MKTRYSRINTPNPLKGALKKKLILILNLSVFLTIFSSCETEPVEIIYADLSDKKGVFISCEGNFMYGNGSLSFYDAEQKQVYNQVFYARNKAPLGDVVQSLATDGENLFIVVNNSGKVIVTDMKTIEFKQTIGGLTSPRYIHFVSGEKAYISDLYARKIAVVNPRTFEKSGYINVSDGSVNSTKHPTETFAQIGDFVFVTCWSYDNCVLVIDTKTDSVVDSIAVPLQPTKIVADINRKLWVLSDGSYAGSPAGHEQPALTRIDPETRTVELIIRWDDNDDRPGDLQLNPAKDSLYILAGNLFKMAVNARRLPDSPMFEGSSKLFFSLGIDPKSGEIYVSDAIDYQQNAVIYRYSPGGTLIDSFTTGINPGGFLFK